MCVKGCAGLVLSQVMQLYSDICQRMFKLDALLATPSSPMEEISKYIYMKCFLKV